MDQKKIGSLLKELRKEKRLTQEQLAEHFNVSTRSVSRWENGINMPELSLLIELADFYNVDIREIIDGERKSENMNREEKDTLLKVADYAENETETTIRVLNQKCNRNFQISYAESRLHETVKKKVPADRYVKEHDILINSTGAGTAGRIAQIGYVPQDTTVDGHMIILRANDKVTQRYLGYALKAHQWEVLQLDEGSTGQTELNRERLLDEIMICYPESFSEQEEIVLLLEGIDHKMLVNTQINDNLAA